MILMVVATVHETETGLCSYELDYFYESGQSGFIQRKEGKLKSSAVHCKSFPSILLYFSTTFCQSL